MPDFHPPYEALYRAAVELVSDAGTASPRFIQRMMNLPYGIAEELFQLMQRDGIAGTVQDARGRVVVVALAGSTDRPCPGRTGSRHPLANGFGQREDRPVMASILVNRAPVLTLWATVVAERLGHPADTALTLGRAVAGAAARIKARNIGREDSRADRDAGTPRLKVEHVTAPVFLLGKDIRLLPNADGELRAADGERPSDPLAVQRYLAKAFGDRLDDVRLAMHRLAAPYDPATLNRSGFRLYEKFRPDVPPGNEGWAAKAVLDINRILIAKP